MKNIFKRILCVVLSITMLFGTGIAAFAADESDVTPVIVVNDIYANPIYNTDDNSVVFDFSDYQFDFLFVSGFSSEIMDLFSEDVMNELTSGEIATMDMITMLVDYLGFSGDVNTIVNKVMELVTGIMGNMSGEGFDVEAILSSIDFEQYLADFKSELENAINNMKLLEMKKDGTPAYENIGSVLYTESLEYYYDEDSELAQKIAGQIGESIADVIGYENTYVFTYDWRLDPVENAAALSEYIENVKDELDAEKVSVISEGYGSVIATTYLAENEDDSADSIHNFVTVSSEFLGTSLMGDFFKGDIVNEFTNLTEYSSAYIRYTNDFSDNPLTAFITWLLNYILNNEWEVQEFCLEIEKILTSANFLMNTTGAIDNMAEMPGLWALVPTEDYEDAFANLFDENVNAELIEKLDTFKNYQDDYESILQDAKDSGINISIVAAWDLQIIPIGENNSVQSDGIVDTAYASFGASCIALNNVAEAKAVIQDDDDGHKHVSNTYDMLTPWYAYGGICKYIDASTCALPENTWFIKNMKHGTFNWESNSIDFIIWLITAEEERTVWQDAAYKQFMTYNRYINPGILSSDGIVAVEAIPGSYLLGDVNLDGIITSLDAVLALSPDDLDPESLSYKNADINGDGEVTEDDAQWILNVSCGLDETMLSGIKFDYETELGSLEESDITIELRPEYNSASNQLELTVAVIDAIGTSNGNFAVYYDTAMFTYSSADSLVLANGFTAAGGPMGIDGTLTCGYASSKAISKKDCDENGALILGTIYLDVSREIQATTLTAGAVYAYDEETVVFVTPVEISLDEDFFFMLGDADGNRYLSAADARTILRIAANLEEPVDDEMFRRCDIDGNGTINASEARLVLRAASKLIKSFDE